MEINARQRRNNLRVAKQLAIIEISPLDELVDTEFILQHGHLFDTEMCRLTEMSAEDKVSYTHTGFITRRGLEILLNLEDLYWKFRNELSRPCEEHECSECENSVWSVIKWKLVPDKRCARKKHVSYESYKDYIDRISLI